MNLLMVLKYKNSKQKILKINAYPLCFGNFLKDVLVDDIKKTELFEYVYDFSVDYYSIDIDDVLDIHERLINENVIK